MEDMRALLSRIDDNDYNVRHFSALVELGKDSVVDDATRERNAAKFLRLQLATRLYEAAAEHYQTVVNEALTLK